MDAGMFVNAELGSVVPINGNDPVTGPWEHIAFVCAGLGTQGLPAIANARAALAALVLSVASFGDGGVTVAEHVLR